ncbi:HAD-superfamily phosphatase [Ascobolus immersus RN42]|uniref:HAD-superfamily phosphatase n=1 Tax=Ascobolus immersus RN42 TaxID=1160509 RepID=A0A3N4I540_ASCIM|nr:HAD-superfamily phosphatase [Ascobolus immersus RN42]
MPLNTTGVTAFLRTLLTPRDFLPHITIPHFTSLPIPPDPLLHPLGLPPSKRIKALVLDKDNLLTLPYQPSLHPSVTAHLAALKAHYNDAQIVIVSNSSGTASEDPDGREAAALEKETGVKVLRHAEMKPGRGCGREVMEYLKGNGSGVVEGGEVLVVGDRVFTDVVLGNRVGGWSCFVRDGVADLKPSVMVRFERRLVEFLLKRGYKPPNPYAGWKEDGFQ